MKLTWFNLVQRRKIKRNRKISVMLKFKSKLIRLKFKRMLKKKSLVEMFLRSFRKKYLQKKLLRKRLNGIIKKRLRQR